jgi:hypothetical protein
MRNEGCGYVRLIPVLALFLCAGGFPALSQAEPKGGSALWDTGRPSKDPLSQEALAGRVGWKAVESAQGTFAGDAVATNGRITFVARKQGAAIEMYSGGLDKATFRLRLILQGAGRDPAAKFDRVALVENSRSVTCLEMGYRTAKGSAVTAKFRLKRGDVFLETDPGKGAEGLRVECPSRFVVLPDFFADDIVIDARGIPLPSTEIPSEHFLLHLAGDGDAIAMCSFENRDQDVRLALTGEKDKRVIKASEIEFGAGRKIYVALLEGAGIWHSIEVTPADAGKVVPLPWKMPFVAQWRADFTRPDGLVDSWAVLLQKQKGGGFTKPSWFESQILPIPPDRKRWTTVLGSFQYPCWSDPQGMGYLQPLESKSHKLRGPVVIYPANRVPETPHEAYTVLDIVRNSLGVGPCQYLLDLDNQKAALKGQATCWMRWFLGEIYKKGEQKSKQKEIDKNLDAVLLCVKHIRSRIILYSDFMRQMREYLAAQLKAHPELKEPIGALDLIAQEAGHRYRAREEMIKTPEHVTKMNEDFRKNLMEYEGPDALDKCKVYTKELVEVGDNQDELAGELRWVVRALRQKAGLLLAADPRMEPIVLEIRAKTQKVLRSPAHHESDRH